jgi:TusA-related sulfurtransferase
VITDDPLAGLDIPNFCNEYDQELVDQKTGEGQDLHFLIKRTDTKL